MPNFYNCEQIVWKQKDFLEGIINVANRGICFALSISWLSLCYKRIHLTDDDLLIARIKDAFEETTKHKMILGNVALNAILFQQEYTQEERPGDFNRFLEFCKKYINEIFKFYDVEDNVTATVSYEFDNLNMADKIIHAITVESVNSMVNMGIIGFYYNHQAMNKRGKHAIAVIRAHGQYFVFDPNFGLCYCNTNERFRNFIEEFVEKYQIKNGVVAKCEAV